MDKVLEFIPFDNLESTWKAMETETVSPFMYYDYMRYIVRDEKRNPFHSVRIACIKDGNSGEIRMIVPLVYVRGRKPYYKMLGDIGGCDIADALYKDGISEEDKLECIRFFYDSFPGPMKLFRLWEQSPLYLNAPKERIVSATPVVYADIPVLESWEAYLASLSGNARHNVTRAFRRMDRDGVEHRLEVYGGDRPLPKEVWALLMKTYYARFHNKYKRGVFSNQTKGGILVQTAKYVHYLTFKKHWFYHKHDSISIPELQNARTYVLWNGDDMISFACGFLTHDRKVCSYPRLAINEKYDYYTPGCVLLAEILQHYMAEGVTEHLDLSRGDEPYKFKMAAIPYNTYDIVLK